MCLESGGSERLQGGVGGAMMASLMARRLIIRKLNLNVNGALSFWGLVGWGIGSDPKSTFGVLRWGWGGKLLVTVQVEKG